MRLLITALFFLLSTALHADEGIKYHSLKQGFVEFINLAEGKDEQTQQDLWLTHLESKATDVYEQVIFQKNDLPNWEKLREENLKRNLPHLFRLKEDILDQFDIFEEQVPPLLNEFVAQNPDIDFDTVEVYAMPSLMGFNGRVDKTMKDGKRTIVVMFGMDFIAQILLTPELIPGSYILNDLPALVAHEFTHALHVLASNIEELNEAVPRTLLKFIYMEGIASYMSEVMVAGTSFEFVMMDKYLAENCNEENIPKWSQLFLEDIKLTGDVNLPKLYRKWFGAGKTTLPIPRIGYCLGYQVLDLLVLDYSTKELIRMDHEEVIPKVFDSLVLFAKE